MNMTVTNNDLGTVVIENALYQDATLAFPGADTYVEGTILARREVATAVVAAAGTNTGNGTVTAATVVDGNVVPKVGAYVLTVIEVVAHGGILKLADPDGNVVADYLQMTAGAGVATVFSVAGLQFTVTDGSTDFAAGDSFTLTVAADGKMVVYAAAGVGGAQLPLAVLTYEIVAAGISNVAIRQLVAGRVRRDWLVIDGGGSITDSLVDKLRHVGIVADTVTELNIQDNQ